MIKKITISIIVVVVLSFSILLLLYLNKRVKCRELTKDACKVSATCSPRYGPSRCSKTSSGVVCTADEAYKGCYPK